MSKKSVKPSNNTSIHVLHNMESCKRAEQSINWLLRVVVKKSRLILNRKEYLGGCIKRPPQVCISHWIKTYAWRMVRYACMTNLTLEWSRFINLFKHDNICLRTFYWISYIIGFYNNTFVFIVTWVRRLLN